MTGQRVFVAGGTGVVGRRAVRLLVEAGHTVTALARTAEKAAEVRAAGATPERGDLFDRDLLREAVAGHDVVVNLATSIPPLSKAAVPGSWATNDRIRTEGSTNLVDAVLAAGIGRYVQESIVFPYADAGDRWIDAETGTFDPGKVMAAVPVAEANAARVTEAGGVGVVLRFGQFYAPEASHTVSQVALARTGIGPVVGPPDGYFSLVHADDAATAVVAALDAPAGTYDVCEDEPLTRAEAAAALGAAVGRKPKVLAPGRAAKAGGAATSPLVRSQRVSNRRFKEATGWAPRYPSPREGWAAVVAAMPEPPARTLAERLVRPVLAVLGLVALQLGLWASFAPVSFYEDFPTGPMTWISVDGPYNEHFVRDFGGLQLALAAIVLAALWRPERYLVRVTALAYLLFALPHTLYHAFNLDVYAGTGDKVATMVTLALTVIGPAVLILGTARPIVPGRAHGAPATAAPASP